MALRRSHRRRTLTLRVTPAGVVVYAPAHLSEARVRAAVESKRAWAEQHLRHFHQRLPTQAPRSGMTLLCWGQPLTVLLEDHRAEVQQAGQVLLVPVTHPAAALRRWYTATAQQHYPDLVARYAAALPGGCRPLSAVKVTNAKGRWGSCTAAGVIRLHWRLLLAPVEVLEYVAAHEAAHLRELNHSPRYWAQVAALLPNYAAQERWLKQRGEALMRELSQD